MAIKRMDIFHALDAVLRHGGTTRRGRPEYVHRPLTLERPQHQRIAFQEIKTSAQLTSSRRSNSNALVFEIIAKKLVSPAASA